ncbi:MAG: hypothetical protein CVV14_06135 [Gammaproteobacteria bacterium HGW-Gammaproteobacteria-4]|jgi:hypothetical protein|nr:MAG: hypothetical protein CVV14_06135 [Gammaproteobacteria bacterium HGW-Gammaproteobacteria-4]
MKDLMISELRRFRWLALVAGAVNLLLLLFLNRVSDLLQMSFLDALPMLFIYVAVGLALAIAQVGSYRKPSQWAWLIHRPLAPARIFGALSLSALLLLVFVISLPMLLVLLGTEFLTTRVVDLRHYLMIAHVLMFALMAWMAGAHACVSRSRVAIAVFFAPFLFALHLTSTLALLLPVSLALAWLTWITVRSFRANRDAPIPGTATLLATALALQIGIFLVCMALWKMLFVTGGILLGVDPLNTDFPPKGGLIATERAEPSEEIALGLERSDDPRAASWRTQLPLMEPLRIGPYLSRFPVRHQLSNIRLPTGWYDKDRNVAWAFSHDAMLFIGRNPESGAAHGVFGRGGAGSDERFDSIPVATESGELMTAQALYGIDKETQALELRLVLRDGERFTSSPRRGFNRVLLLTNQRLLVLREDQRAAAYVKPLLLDWELSLPHGPQHLQSATLVELMDGWLVSFVYGDGIRQIGLSQFNALAEPRQEVLFIDADGNAKVVGERQINADFPAIHRSNWWLSPPLDFLRMLPEATLDKGLTWPLQLVPWPRVPALHIAALLMLLLSTATAWWWLRDTRMPTGRRRVWLASCALIGLPALISLFLLEPRELRE